MDNMIKVHYAPGPVVNMAFQQNKLVGLMTKRNRKLNGSVGGKFWFQPIRWGLPGQGSIDFPTAMAATPNSSFAGFSVTRCHHYRRCLVDNETIEATATGDMDAFEPALDEFDRGLEAEANYLNFRAFRTKGGYIGRMTNSAFATLVMTLDDAAGTWAVRQGDTLVLSAADGTSGAVRAGTLVVASVQRRAGTITFTANISTGVAAAAQNDFIFLQKDYGFTDGFSISGMLDWLPDTDPTSTAFFGQDRSLEPEMLGGLRVDGTGGDPIHEIMIQMVVEADNLGAEPDVLFANPRALGTLSKQLEGKWVIMKAQEYGGREAEIGYKGWQVNLEGHEVTIMSDRMCPVKRMFALDIDSWTMFSAGTAPMFLFKRFQTIMKPAESADAYESRIGEYANVSCAAPGHNVQAQLP